MLPEKDIRSLIKNHIIETESEGVKKFYGGECATIIIENSENLDEITNILKITIDRSEKKG
jgi:hypothetical protein